MTLALLALMAIPTQWGSYQACGNTNCEMCYGATSMYTGRYRTRTVAPKPAEPPLPKDYAGTPKEAIKQALQHAQVGPESLYVDLGAGDGRTVQEAKRRGARAVGYEIDAGLVRRAKQAGANVSQADMFQVKLKGATHIWCYHTSDRLARLRVKFANLPAGVSILSWQHPLPATPVQRVFALEQGTLYLYRTPLEVD